MSEYVVSCDALEMPEGSNFTVLPGPVEPGSLALVEIEGWLIAGRLVMNRLILPNLILEIDMPFRVIGPVIPMEEGKIYLN
jgi:hypothetical protein